MLDKVLPKFLQDTLFDRINADKLYEIRLRNQRPVSINYGGKYYFVSKSGLQLDHVNAYVVDNKAIDEVILKATDYSIYAATKQINSGYITIMGGIRIGISGDVVYNKDEIIAVKNYNALNIRVPHQVPGCSSTILPHIVYSIGNCKRVRNTLVLSPPGAGKTTILRDIARTIMHNNILVVDERSEIAACYNGIPQLDVGVSTDVISNCGKMYAFTQGIRAMRPDVIVTDEIATASDTASIEYALSSGVAVVASIHARSVDDLRHKTELDKIVSHSLFDRIVVLSNREGPGTIESILDGNMVAV